MIRIWQRFWVTVGFSMIGFASSISAQTYPTKPIRMILPFTGGGDILARPLAQMLGEALGQPVYVENIVGGQTLVGTEAAARAPGDGHTILMITNSATINHTLRTDMRVDLFKDFVPVTQLCTFSLVLVTHPSVPATSLQSLIAHAKANPGKLAYGSAGPLYQLPTELFKSMAGVDILYVPYKASATSRIDVLSGQIQVLMDGLNSMLPQIKAGKVRAIAVAGAKRSHAAPDIPTFAESGLPGYEGDGWLGILAPAGTPAHAVNRLQAEMAKILARPAVQAFYREQANEPITSTPAEYAEFLRQDVAKWAKVIRELGAKPAQ
jgi:tripartite-type tricarboxylate transporter receptor subunit TctC